MLEQPGCDSAVLAGRELLESVDRNDISTFRQIQFRPEDSRVGTFVDIDLDRAPNGRSFGARPSPTPADRVAHSLNPTSRATPPRIPLVITDNWLPSR